MSSRKEEQRPDRIWLQSSYPWAYTTDLSRRLAIGASVMSYIARPDQNGMSVLSGYGKETVIPLVTSAALAGAELIEAVVSVLLEIGEDTVDPTIALLSQSYEDGFYRVAKQAGEADIAASWTTKYAVRNVRRTSLDSLSHIAYRLLGPRDWIPAVRSLARLYQSGNYGDEGIVAAATRLDTTFAYMESPFVMRYFKESEQRMRDGQHRAQELEREAIMCKRAAQAAQLEAERQLADAANMLWSFLEWKKRNQ